MEAFRKLKSFMFKKKALNEAKVPSEAQSNP